MTDYKTIQQVTGTTTIATVQTQQFNRVAATTKEAILDFINERLTSYNGVFTSNQLRFYVSNNVVGGVSPSSADRVLRMLRQKNKINYIVLNRGKSLYRAVPVSPLKFTENGSVTTV
jgi:hypothetical protein